MPRHYSVFGVESNRRVTKHQATGFPDNDNKIKRDDAEPRRRLTVCNLCGG